MDRIRESFLRGWVIAAEKTEWNALGLWAGIRPTGLRCICIVVRGEDLDSAGRKALQILLEAELNTRNAADALSSVDVN